MIIKQFNNIKSKLKKGENPTDKETLLLSLVPLTKKGNGIQESIEEVCEILSQLKKNLQLHKII